MSESLEQRALRDFEQWFKTTYPLYERQSPAGFKDTSTKHALKNAWMACARRLMAEQGEPVGVSEEHAEWVARAGMEQLHKEVFRSLLKEALELLPGRGNLRRRITQALAKDKPKFRTPPPSDALDAKRLRHFVKGIGAVREFGRQQFTYQPVFPLPDTNLMKGSVAEHWLAAIDAAMEKSHE